MGCFKVTGKFRTGVNPFDEGLCHNWRAVVCSSAVPSYLRFKRRQHEQREILEARCSDRKAAARVKAIKQQQKQQQQQERQKHIYRAASHVSEQEAVAFVGKNSNYIQGQQENVLVSSKEMKKSKRGMLCVFSLGWGC